MNPDGAQLVLLYFPTIYIVLANPADHSAHSETFETSIAQVPPTVMVSLNYPFPIATRIFLHSVVSFRFTDEATDLELN